MGKLIRLAPVLIIAAIPALVLPVLTTKSVTVDEYVHIPAGSLSLSTGTFRHNAEQPPLPKIIPALWLRTKGVLPPESEGEGYRKFWRENALSMDEILFHARLPMILASIALGALIYTWARSLYGPRGGMISLAAYAFSPTVLGHTGLVTGDLAGALGCLLAIRLFWGAFQDPSPVRLVLLGGSLGLALLCKLSAILLPVGMVIFVGLALWRGKEWRLRPALAILGMALVVWAGYGFEMAPLAQEAKMPSNEKVALVLSASPVLKKAYEIAATKAPVPARSFWRGLDRVRKHNRHGHPAFFLGERSRKGWWTYFPVAFVLKTSLPLLVLMGLLAGTFWSGRSEEPWAEILILVVGGTFFLLAMTSRINIGIRHVLPVYVFVFVLLGRLGTIRIVPKKVLAGTLCVLLGWHAVEALRTCPDYLAYFQPLTGGSSQGHRYLVDSNLDWGQDLKGLKGDLDRRGQKDLHLAYFGPVDPAEFGVSYLSLPPGEETGGFVAISATSLQLGIQGMKRQEGDPYGWLRKYPVQDTVGGSILIYVVPEG